MFDTIKLVAVISLFILFPFIIAGAVRVLEWVDKKQTQNDKRNGNN